MPAALSIESISVFPPSERFYCILSAVMNVILLMFKACEAGINSRLRTIINESIETIDAVLETI